MGVGEGGALEGERKFSGEDVSDELEDRIGVSPVSLDPGCT